MTTLHPLATLRAADIDGARTALQNAGMLSETVRFVYVGVEEPTKSDALAAERASLQVDRRVRVMLIDLSDGHATDVVVSVSSGEVVRKDAVDATSGQPPLTVAEFGIVDEIVGADAGWKAALAARDLAGGRVIPTPLSAGNFNIEGEQERRMVRVVAFVELFPGDNPWAHPVDGLCAWVDLISRTVVRLVDTGVVPMPLATGNFHKVEDAGQARTDLHPFEITQPVGSSFSIVDNEIRWADWRLRVGFDAREGLVLHRIRLAEGDDERDVVYRASIPEMVVPYADPTPVHFFQNYFDAGEYLYGRTVNSLELGCDCLGEITYMDAILSDELGRPTTVKNAICIHEEDTGVLWKHTEAFLGGAAVRRGRRLVVSSFTTVGNYDYGFYWYFYLDGRIECEAKLNGIVFTAAYGLETTKTSSQITAELSAPYHQHLFGARLDMMVDGVRNTVEEVDFTRMPVGPNNPYGNAFTTTTTPLTTELAGARDADATLGRTWRITSADKVNAVGEPTAYQLLPEAAPTLLADSSSSIAGRAAFTTHHLWVTRYEPGERYPAGDFVYQSPAGSGLPEYVADDAPIESEDIVIWHSFGLSHAPRLEDWPIMPVDHTGFTLRPSGFFDRNPSLNAPAPITCSPEHHGDEHDHKAHHSHGAHG
ncbi:UNVERIFIED_ORG: primary-amine oxidase [Paenarthrobacter nicotinovorans]